jgi:hypothetical protein
MDKYNTLIVCLSVLCILLLVIILSKRKNESFQVTPDPAKICPFTANNGESHAVCIARCYNEVDRTANPLNNDQKEDCKDDTSETGCIKKCGKESDQCVLPGPEGFTKCIINPYLDISGDNIQQCIDRCAENTKNCDGCKTFVIPSDLDNAPFTDTYTNSLDDLKKCSPESYNQKYCSPCVKACKDCKDSNLCRWVTKTNPDTVKDFLKASFTIGVMPENKSALLVWNETRSDVSKYLIFVYKKSDRNVDERNIQQTPLTVRTIERNYTNLGTNSHLLKGLSNGVTYSITVNKISSMIEQESKEKVVKSSNTIDIVPSPVTVINFSRLNRDNSLKQNKLQSQNFMDGIKGKTFDITL